MTRRLLTALYAAVALSAAAILAAPAFADGASGASSFGTTGLVRGGAALPRFSLGLPLEVGGPGPAPAGSENLEISLTSPDHGVLRFLFSPRAVGGETYGFGPTVTGNYVGLAWNIFDNSRIFGSIGFSGAVNREGLDDPSRSFYGTPLLSLHSTLELGYAFSGRQSLSIALDHATPAPYLGDRNAAGDYLRLRYGYHF
jgi:hypothetical protein